MSLLCCLAEQSPASHPDPSGFGQREKGRSGRTTVVFDVGFDYLRPPSFLSSVAHVSFSHSPFLFHALFFQGVFFFFLLLLVCLALCLCWRDSRFVEVCTPLQDARRLVYFGRVDHWQFSAVFCGEDVVANGDRTLLHASAFPLVSHALTTGLDRVIMNPPALCGLGKLSRRKRELTDPLNREPD